MINIRNKRLISFILLLALALTMFPYESIPKVYGTDRGISDSSTGSRAGGVIGPDGQHGEPGPYSNIKYDQTGYRFYIMRTSDFSVVSNTVDIQFASITSIKERSCGETYVTYLGNKVYDLENKVYDGTFYIGPDKHLDAFTDDLQGYGYVYHGSDVSHGIPYGYMAFAVDKFPARAGNSFRRYSARPGQSFPWPISANTGQNGDNGFIDRGASQNFVYWFYTNGYDFAQDQVVAVSGSGGSGGYIIDWKETISGSRIPVIRETDSNDISGGYTAQLESNLMQSVERIINSYVRRYSTDVQQGGSSSYTESAAQSAARLNIMNQKNNLLQSLDRGSPDFEIKESAIELACNRVMSQIDSLVHRAYSNLNLSVLDDTLISYADQELNKNMYYFLDARLDRNIPIKIANGEMDTDDESNANFVFQFADGIEMSYIRDIQNPDILYKSVAATMAAEGLALMVEPLVLVTPQISSYRVKYRGDGAEYYSTCTFYGTLTEHSKFLSNVQSNPDFDFVTLSPSNLTLYYYDHERFERNTNDLLRLDDWYKFGTYGEYEGKWDEVYGAFEGWCTNTINGAAAFTLQDDFSLRQSSFTIVDGDFKWDDDSDTSNVKIWAPIWFPDMVDVDLDYIARYPGETIADYVQSRNDLGLGLQAYFVYAPGLSTGGLRTRTYDISLPEDEIDLPHRAPDPNDHITPDEGTTPEEFQEEKDRWKYNIIKVYSKDPGNKEYIHIESYNRDLVPGSIEIEHEENYKVVDYYTSQTNLAEGRTDDQIKTELTWKYCTDNAASTGDIWHKDLYEVRSEPADSVAGTVKIGDYTSNTDSKHNDTTLYVHLVCTELDNLTHTFKMEYII